MVDNKETCVCVQYYEKNDQDECVGEEGGREGGREGRGG